MTLYNALDTDGKGSIDLEEFLLLRGAQAGRTKCSYYRLTLGRASTSRRSSVAKGEHEHIL